MDVSGRRPGEFGRTLGFPSGVTGGDGVAADVSGANEVVGVYERGGIPLSISECELAVDGSGVVYVDVVDAALFHVREVAEVD